MEGLNKNVFNQFIIQVALIEPVEEIVNKLKKGQFRDCDINWLDKKLETFVEFTAKTLNINSVMQQPESVKPKYITTDYGKNYYINYFNTLLSYFKSL